jgi:hypothetical protein
MVPKVRREGKFYFVSVREPLDTYLSLYNYGLDRKGELYCQFMNAGLGRYYNEGMAGFAPWLEFVLDPDNAKMLYPKGCSAIAQQLGLVSFRFLRLACLGFEKQSSTLDSRQTIVDYADAHRITDAVIHYESMQQELLTIVKGPLQHAFADLPEAMAWIEASPRINASRRRDRQEGIDLSDELRARLVEREWYLYQTHYADQQETA